MPKMPSDFYSEFQNLEIREEYIQTLTRTPKLARWSSMVFKIASSEDLDIIELANYLVNQNIGPNTEPKIIIEDFLKKTSNPTASSQELKKWVATSISNNPDLVKKYKSGKSSVIGAFVGDVMKRSKGSADAKEVTKLLKESLEK